MKAVIEDILAALRDDRYPAWFLVDDLVKVLEAKGHHSKDVLAQVDWLINFNVIDTMSSLTGDMLVKLASRLQTNGE